MSTFESYETEEEGPFESQESYEGAFETQESLEGPFETGGMHESMESYEGAYESGYETQEAEDEQFLGSILGALTGESEGPLSESQEVELAAELLEVTSEDELEEFLGNLIKGVAKGVGGIIRSPIGQQLGGILKGVAKKALPIVGGALGSFVAPGVGTAIGSKLGSMASNLFEMETEGMSHEQAQFEVARRYVRFASTAAQRAATAPRSAPPRQVVQRAVTTAARQHAPGLLRGTRPGGGYSRGGQRPRPSYAYGQGRPRHRRRRPLGVAAYPVGGSTVVVPGGNGGEPSYGAPSWGDEPYEPQGGQGRQYGPPSSYGGRARSGRWIRRGRRIVLLGV
jgi:uncharacterized protein (DUF697 family)